MKKLFLVSVVVLFTTFIFSSCSKDVDKVNLAKERNINVSVQPNIEKDISSSDWLFFNSREDYESAIVLLNENERNLSLFEQGLQFTSMRCALSEKQRESIGVEDDLLATLLNPDGFIRIGNFIFKIDIVNNSAIVWDANNGNEKRVFSIDDNVLDILFNKEESYESKGSNPDPVVYEFESSPKSKCEVVYQRAAVYFSLLSKINKPGVISAPEVEIYYSTDPGTYTRNRNNATQQTFAAQSDGGDGNSCQYRPYSAAVGLKQFYMSTFFNCIDYSPYYSDAVRLTISK